MTIQEIVLDIMRKEGVTQSELAKRLGVSRQSVSDMLHGADMKVSTVVRVLSVLGYVFRIERMDGDE